MSFQPALPIGGYAGWRFLKRTMASQQAAFAASPVLQRDTAYFREKIGQIDRAEQLVADRRLLRVALGAFGLEGDLGNRFFIRKVLEEGTLERGSLANRLADSRYAELSRAFGFDLGTPHSKTTGFGERIARAYETRQFEIAVGEQDNDMRLALTLQRELGALAARSGSAAAKWFTVLGNPPLRRVFETVYGLPTAFGALDIDRQREVMETRTRATFGKSDLAQFSDAARMEALVQRFLLQADLRASGALGAAAPGATALQLLSAAAPVLRMSP